MADQTQTNNNPDALQSDNDPSGNDESSVAGQTGQPNEMPDRGQSDASQGDQFDRKPEQARGADAMNNEGGNQSSSDMQNKGMGEDEKSPKEGTSRESQRS